MAQFTSLENVFIIPFMIVAFSQGSEKCLCLLMPPQAGFSGCELSIITPFYFPVLMCTKPLGNTIDPSSILFASRFGVFEKTLPLQNKSEL